MKNTSLIVLLIAVGMLLGGSPTVAQTLNADVVLPVRSPISSWWDATPGPSSTHKGSEIFALDLNLFGNDFGEPVYAILAGEVTASFFNSSNLCGNTVDIWYPAYNIKTHYCHLNTRTVSTGDIISAGTQVGTIGDTGLACVPSCYHLHFAMYNTDAAGNYVSPFDPLTLTIFENLGTLSGPGTPPPPGPTPPPGDPPIVIPPGSIPEIGGLKLEVGWPAIPIPGGSVTLNDIAKEEKICLSTILVFAYAISLWIAAILAAIGVVYVGIAYIFSGSRPGLQAQASRRVRKIFIGFIILFLAVVILNAIDPGLATFRTCGPGSEIKDVPLEMIEI